MHLKRLEIQGFKSLADRIELHFDPGITAVVGPNGSGKSNIADSIRWVLGEQSAKSLRGAKMEDIIFSGSDKRKSVGMAEVSLTLDNSDSFFSLDFSEITVTRRVYRSGESEYLINKSPSKLREINEIFMDTGIGREGYSIIGQGRIDEILSSRSEDRRIIIEEAAGILKYKNRKGQAARKLHDTEQNLVRVRDIIGELETQVEPLHEQSVLAEKYLRLKNYLDELEISLLVSQMADQRTRLAELNRSREEHQARLLEKETGLRGLESAIEELRLKAGKAEEEINSLMRENFQTGSLLDQQESKIGVARERIKDAAAQRDQLTAEIAALKLKENEGKERLAADLLLLTELRERIQSEGTRLAAEQAELAAVESSFTEEQKMIEQKKADMIEHLNETARVRNALSSGESEILSLKRRAAQLTEQKETLVLEGQALRAKENELAEKKLTLERILEEKRTELKRHAEDKNQLQERLRQKNQEAARLQDSCRQKDSRLKALQELQKDYEGYNRGVKEVLTAHQKGKECRGVCGVVAELIKVPEKYETAVEVALGGALQHIVTESDLHAKEAVEFLKRNKAGRATFLPLNTIRPAGDRGRAGSGSGSGRFGVAAKLVECEPKFRHIVDYLLGRVLVVDCLATALNLAAEIGYSLKIVTLDGDVVNAGGSITGGSYRKGSANLLSRIREIEELAGQKAGLEAEMRRLTEAVQTLEADLSNCGDEMAAVEETLRSLAMDKAAAEKDLEMTAQEGKRIQGFLDTLTGEKAMLAEEIKLIETKLANYSVRLDDLESAEKDLRQGISDQQAALSGRDQERSRLSETVLALKVALAGLQEKEINQARNLKRSEELRADLEIEIIRKSRQVEQLADQTQAYETEISRGTEEIRRLSGIRSQQEDRLNGLKNDKMSLTGEIRIKEADVKKMAKETGQLQETLHAEDIRLARLEMELENSTGKLQEEYNISFEKALALPRPELPKRELLGRIRTLKEEIAGLGSVNIGAIEEYKRVRERYEFLNRQYTDLEQAKDSLYRVIAEMDEIMTTRFGEAFREINQNFGTVFARLFGGGRAELRMTDPDAILECGIDIVAQPPGKKAQNLLLLSGGERALTAISLMFAVLQTKPTPFCVLDEIEAALDEANLDRVARFLKEFDQKTQFIVITHRKRTMEAADVIYGVTMDDSRVTKLVSMRFEGKNDKVS